MSSSSSSSNFRKYVDDYPSEMHRLMMQTRLMSTSIRPFWSINENAFIIYKYETATGLENFLREISETVSYNLRRLNSNYTLADFINNLNTCGYYDGIIAEDRCTSSETSKMMGYEMLEYVDDPDQEFAHLRVIKGNAPSADFAIRFPR
jgi:hypothetical protein